MNVPPKQFIRVAPEPMRAFVKTVFEKVGMMEENAGLIAQLLVLNDLRGVFSHGTQQVPSYVGQFQKGQLNLRPNVRVVSESSATLLVDGDGGLGYFPAYRAANEVVEKAKAQGIAAAVTRNHGHIGAAGLYSRIPLQHNLVGYVTSGHQLHLSPNQSIMGAAGGSPMSFAVPAGDAPPLALDFGAMHDLYSSSPSREGIFDMAPGMVFRSIGLGAVCQSLGGFLAGVPSHPDRAKRAFPGANQGSLIIALDIARFIPLEDFLREMEDYMRRAMQMQPMPGYDRAYLPGGLEWEREREWSQIGIPVGEEHQRALRRVGEALGVETPF
jgi:LDH2 family malate/lactate/ureidoglycolate dehydrogenase